MSASLAIGMALVLSHFAALPALVYLGWMGLVSELAVLSTCVAVSTAYHMCQVGWFCFGVDLIALQISDHFLVFFAFVWMLMYSSGAPERIRATVTIVIMGPTLPVIISHLDSWVAGAMAVGLGIAAFFIAFIAYAWIRGGVTVKWRAFGVALALILIGIRLHINSGDFSSSNVIYPMAHTVWHVLAFGALYFASKIQPAYVLPSRKKNRLREPELRARTERLEIASPVPRPTRLRNAAMPRGGGVVLSLRPTDL